MKRFITALFFILAWPAFGQRHVNVAKGLDPGKSYGLGTIDTINHFNGNLTLTIPIGQTFPLSSRLSYGLSAHYNSTVWDIENVYRPCPTEQCADCVCPFVAAYPDRRSNAGMGWALSFGRLYSPWAITNETGTWVWESPNGSDHQFGEDRESPGTWYTADSTYMRMRSDGTTRRLVEFPDGTVHEYVPGPEGPSGVWRLEKIRDRFEDDAGNAVNWMHIQYVVRPGGATDWRITDSSGRRHHVKFVSLEYDNKILDFVDYVAFGVTYDQDGNSASYNSKYDFTYEQHDTARHSADTDTPAPPYYGLDDRPTVQGLTTIELRGRSSGTSPVADANAVDLGQTYNMAYRWTTTNDDWSGVVKSVTLPTGAKIEWDACLYHMPAASVEPDEQYFSVVKGVQKRTVTDPADPVSGTAEWTYTDSVDGDYNDMSLTTRPRKFWNTVVDPMGNVTEYYFNVITNYDSTWTREHYGLPFSALTVDSGNRYLSVREYQGSATNSLSDCPLDDPEGLQKALKRSRYLRYTGEGTANAYNLRVESSSIQYHDDLVGNVPVFASSDWSDFDGLGHYRRLTTGGTFAAGNVREQFTNYNPGCDSYPGTSSEPYCRLPENDAWVLGTFSETRVTEGGSNLRTQFCFDGATGKLLRQRRLAGTILGPTGVVAPLARDILDVFDHDTSGNVSEHVTYGGDGGALGGGDLCTLALPSPVYRIGHVYSNGVLARSTYKGPSTNAALPFSSLNLTIERDTGLATTSTDTSGLTTSYSYDGAGRLKTLTPPGGELPTTFSYPAASGTGDAFVPAHINVTKGSVVSQQQFDGLGRLWREKTTMFDGTWNVRETERNLIGWVTSVSEFEKLTTTPAAPSEYDFEPSHKTLYGSFDAFGRPGFVIAPDDTQSQITYKGIRQVTRTRSVATTATSETVVATKEEFDRQGRLHKVTENSGSSSDDVATTYDYDAGGHLKSVETTSDSGPAQPKREFAYDGRGFLTSESHPESGTTLYSYDAGGHVTLRDTAGADLSFNYDDAGRLEDVREVGVPHPPDAHRLLKTFKYDRPNSATAGIIDYSMGKMDYAIRHNYHEIGEGGDITVRETYRYEGLGGRLSAKETQISPDGQTFTESYAFDDFGALRFLTYPNCVGCTSSAVPSRTIVNDYSHGFLTAVPGYASSITYHSNGLLATIQHTNAGGTNGPLFTQTHSGTNGLARPEVISVSGFCRDYLFTTHPQSQTITRGQSTTLTANAPGTTSYAWFTTDGTRLQGTTGSVSVNPSVTTSYYARATNGSCSVDSAIATVTVRQCSPPTINVEGSTTVSQGSPALIQATLTGSGPWLVTWEDESTPRSVTASPYTRSVTPLSTTTYRVSAISDSEGCAGTFLGSGFIVTVVIPPPVALTATAATLPTRINVSWSFSGSHDTFEIERRSGNNVRIDSSSSPWFTDSFVAPNTTYVYRVRAKKGGTYSAASVGDLATTMTFADDPLPTRALIKGQHIIDLRAAANAVSAAASLSEYPFEDASLAGVRMKAVHIRQLREALDEARLRLSLPPLTYASPLLATGAFINRLRIEELRGGVK